MLVIYGAMKKLNKYVHEFLTTSIKNTFIFRYDSYKYNHVDNNNLTKMDTKSFKDTLKKEFLEDDFMKATILYCKKNNKLSFAIHEELFSRILDSFKKVGRAFVERKFPSKNNRDYDKEIIEEDIEYDNTQVNFSDADEYDQEDDEQDDEEIIEYDNTQVRFPDADEYDQEDDEEDDQEVYEVI